MVRMDFNQWTSMYQIQRGLDKAIRRLTVPKVYERLHGFFARRKDPMSILSCYAEEAWYRHGQPYYKIWPGMANSLANISIDIDGKYLHLPFPTYEIRFPKSVPITEGPGHPVLKAMLVHRCDREDFDRKDDCPWSFIVHYQFDTDLKNDWMGWYFSLGIKEGETLDERFNKTWKWSTHYETGYEPKQKFISQLVRIAVAVAFFGIHEHQMVLPDIPYKFVDRYHRAKASKDAKEQKDLLEKAKRLHHYGWLVGSEIDLPQAVVRHINEGGRTEPGRELQFGHVRSGHMRLQPYGPKDNPTEYKLIFISPSMVRPDLPLQQVRGFRIGAS